MSDNEDEATVVFCPQLELEDEDEKTISSPHHPVCRPSSFCLLCIGLKEILLVNL